MFGVETYQKPEVGVRPSWVDEQITISPKVLSAYNSLKENHTDYVKRELLIKYLEDIQRKIINYANATYSSSLGYEEYINAYAATRDIRKEYLQLITNSIYCSDRSEFIGDFFESVYNDLEINSSYGNELGRIFLHELFIYTITGFLKNKSYSDAGYLLGRTYFPARTSNRSLGKSYSLFYSGSYHTNLDNAVKKRDNRDYHSGTAQYWISTLDMDFCTKEDFTAADAICFNYSLYGNGYLDNWPWFPVTYVYANEYDNFITRLGRQLSSKEKLKKILPLFNFDKIEDFIARCVEVENAMQKGQYRDYRYSSAFESAPLISGSIKASDLGQLR